MFYCDNCAKEKDWPSEWWRPKSHGPCELCKTVTECSDVPSSALPGAKPPPCGACLDFDGDVRVKYACSLPWNHLPPHEAWTNNIVTDDPEADRHARWTHDS